MCAEKCLSVICLSLWVLNDEKIVGEKSTTVPLKPQPWKWECRPVRGAACAGDDETVHTGHMAHWALLWRPVVRWRPVIGCFGRRAAWLQWDVTRTRTHTRIRNTHVWQCVCICMMQSWGEHVQLLMVGRSSPISVQPRDSQLQTSKAKDKLKR